MKKKNIALLLSAVLVLVGAVGVTIAWLTEAEGPVTNTFTVGKVNIDLTESDSKQDTDQNKNTNAYKMIPGFTYVKNPTVTVFANSEDCLVFVKVIENISFKEGKSGQFTNYIDYQVVPPEWTPLDGTAGVYYRTVSASDGDQLFSVIGYEKDGIVTKDRIVVKDTVTKDMMDALSAEPTLTFKAAAIQLKKDNTSNFDPAEAYAKLPEAFKTN